MTIRPETVIVETHGMFDAGTETVTGILEDTGYEVVHVEEMGGHDISILTAEYRGE